MDPMPFPDGPFISGMIETGEQDAGGACSKTVMGRAAHGIFLEI
jgi:hypothetical protein